MSKRTGRAKVNTPIEELEEKETLVHYNSIIIEEFNSKMQLILEVVQANADQLKGIDKRLGSLERRVESMENRLTAVEKRLDVVEKRLDSVESRLTTLELAFRVLKDDMLDMERRLCSKINRLIERDDNHEFRIAALEA